MRYFWIFILILSGFFAKSQVDSIPSSQYNNKNQLSSNTYFYSFQDSRGYLWFSGKNGLTRLSGNNWTNYSLDDLNLSTSVAEVFEDEQQILWMIDMNNQLSYLDQDGLSHPYRYNKELKEFCKNNTTGLHLKNSLSINNNVLSLNFESYPSIKILANGEFISKKPIEEIRYLVDSNSVEIHNIIKNKTAIKTQEGFFSSQYSPSENFKYQTSVTQVVSIESSIYFNCGGNSLVKFTAGEHKSLDFKDIIIYMYKDKNELYISVRNDGIYRITKNFNAIKLVDAASLIITSVVKDQNNSWWLTTLNNGIIHYPNFQSRIKTNKAINTEPIAESQKNGIKINKGVLKGQFSMPKIKKSSQPEVVRSAISVNDALSYDNDVYISSYSDCYRLQGDSIFYLYRRLKGKWNDTLFIDSFPHSKHFYHVNLFNDTVYFTSKRNIFKLSKNNKLELLPVTFNSQIINVISNDHQLVAMSSSGEVFTLNKHFQFYDTLGVSNIQNFTISNTNNLEIYILAKKTILVAKLINDTFKIHYTNSFKYNLSEFDLNSIKTNNSSIILSNKNIQVEIPKEDFSSKILKTELVPKQSEGVLEFDINLFDHGSNVKTEYFYRLKENEKFKRRRNNSFYFESLSEGSYNLQVYVKDEIGRKSKVHSYSFTIPTPIWRSSPFILLYVISSSLIIILIFKIRLKRKELILRLETETLAHKQDTLKAQLNPHFLFNALSTIQSMVVTNQVKETNFYVKNLAKLIRSLLDSSIDREVTIEKEIELLQSYLNIEKINTINPFDFTINVDEELIEDEVKIPSMLVQPFVENAIKHAFKDQTDAHINLNFLDKDDHILVEIIDNGIGIQSKPTNKDHTSRAMKIIQERIELIKVLRKKTILLNTEISAGTKISLEIPIS